MIYIRVDMNNVIATGHVMRCLAIADALRSFGEDTTFITADEQAVPVLQAKNYKYVILNTKWNKLDSELPVLERVIQEKNIKSIFVDSYQVTNTYFSTLRKLVKIIYIDDLNAFRYPVDKLICYANYWKNMGYTEHYRMNQLLLGTKYVPLRKEFSKCPRKVIESKLKRVLVLSGGTDPCNVLGQFLKRIDYDKFERIDLICGRYSQSYDGLRKYNQNKCIHIHKNVSDIEQYMKAADVAISAAGSTLYELCACGTPTISYTFADNQVNNARQFFEDGIMDYAGDARREDIVGNIIKYVEQYISDFQLRKERSFRMQKLVDGRGALRIAEELINMGKEV